MNRPATDQSPLTPRRRWIALAVLTLAIVILAVDATVLYLAVPSLTEDLSPSAAQILWIGDIYSLAIASLLIVMGALADRIGRKRLLLIGAAGFGAASALAAWSTGPEMLIAARFLLGVTGATLMPSCLALIRNIFPDASERARAIAIWSAAMGGGAALGPVVGGLLLEHFWWGSVFIINLPIMAVLVVAGAVVLPESRDPDPGRFDLVSAALSMACLIPVVYAIKHAVTSGVSPVMFAMLAAGLVFGAWFVRRQRRLEAPLLDISLFRVPAFTGAVTSTFISVFAMLGFLFFFSQYLQLVRGYTPFVAGLAELPATVASIVVVVLVGVALRRVGRGRSIGISLFLISLGLAGMAAALEADHYVWLALTLIPIGLGVGIATALSTDTGISAAPPQKSGAASAVSETAYELGVGLGIAVLGSIVTYLYRSGVPIPDGASAADATHIRESLATALPVLEHDPAAAEGAMHAFVEAMQITSLVAAAVTLVSVWVAWALIPSDRTTDTVRSSH